MDVTNENFRGALHLLQRILPGASFVAVDFEFSGIGFSRPSQLDTPQQRYTVARGDSRDFPPLQFGISVFHRLTTTLPNPNGHPNTAPGNGIHIKQTSDSPNKSNASISTTDWHTTTFNFNLHPRAVYFPFSQRYPLIDREFRFQASSVHFLSSHGFDFAKNFANGISWLRKSEEIFLRKTVSDIYTARRNPKSSVPSSDISKEDAAYIAMYKQNLDNWISRNDHPEAQTSNPPPKIGMLEYPRAPFLRRLVFDLIRQNYPRIACIVCNLQEGLRLRVALHASAQLAELHRMRDLQMEVEQAVSKEVAARLVFDLIHHHSVTLVVHNGLVDLTKWVSNFVQDLPPHLSDFKQVTKNLFGRVFDTKWAVEQLRKSDPDVAKSLPQEPFTHCDLTHYVEALRKVAFERKLDGVMDIKTFIPKQKWYDGPIHERAPLSERLDHVVLSEYDDEFDDEDEDILGFSRYACDEHNDFKHEAGFDALETGTLFALICALLGENQFHSLTNKIYLGSCGGYKYIDLDSTEDTNDWFEKCSIIVSGEFKEEQPQRIREHRNQYILRLILEKTEFDDRISEHVVIGKGKFAAVLKVRENGNEKSIDSNSELEKVIANAKKVGLDVVRYQLQSLTEKEVANNDDDSGAERNKRRKMG